MIWVSNWKYILLHDRALIWPYLKIHARRAIYWGSLSPILLSLFVAGVIGSFVRSVGELIYSIFDLLGGGINFLLRKSGYMNFAHRTEDCYKGLASYAWKRRQEREAGDECEDES